MADGVKAFLVSVGLTQYYQVDPVENRYNHIVIIKQRNFPNSPCWSSSPDQATAV